MSIFNKKPLSRKDILKVEDVEIEEVEVPEWGGVVYVKGMTGIERETFENAMLREGNQDGEGNIKNIRAKLASMSICDEEGKLLFSIKDVEKLGGKSAAALMRVFDVAQRLSGLRKGDVEELAEEMSANPSNGSASD